MSEDINLCEILKGHEGETFYCSLIGKDVQLYKVVNKIVVIKYIDKLISLLSNGEYIEDGEMQLFPSRNQRDWVKWIEEQKTKTPKTWSELKSNQTYYAEIHSGNKDYCVDITGCNTNGFTRRNTPIEKSALALLKIHQLIEVGYGGNISDEEWSTYGNVSFIIFCNNCGEFEITRSNERQHLAFHTQEQAEEFLSHPDNVQLIKDYFMI